MRTGIPHGRRGIVSHLDTVIRSAALCSPQWGLTLGLAVLEALLHGLAMLLRASASVVACLLVTGCSASATTTTGVVRYTSPALCIGKDRAMGLCLRGGDARGHHVGDCVTIRYTGTVDAPKSLLIVGPADPRKHPGDCPAASR